MRVKAEVLDSIMKMDSMKECISEGSKEKNLHV